jgi:hypothetical protein
VSDQYIQHVSGMAFRNSTRINSVVLMHLFAESMAGWPLDKLTVWVRYTRGADYSGTCYDGEGRIYVNVGRHVAFPYRIHTHIARSVTAKRHWIKPVYTVELADPAQLAVFIFLHECYHWLIRRARRNRRQKESMCDRFAARFLVNRFGCAVRDEKGRLADRDTWDFQDLDRFVAGARRKTRSTPQKQPAVQQSADFVAAGEQLLLFD